MQTTKRKIQRNLPLELEYTLTGSFYVSLEDGAGGCCENCGKVICNVAVVRDSYGKVYHVGMDCAETLTGVKNSFELMQHQYQFDQAKQARQTILKMIKKGANVVKVETFEHENNFFKEVGSGIWRTESAPFTIATRNFKQYRKETWQQYVLPMIKNLVTH